MDISSLSSTAKSLVDKKKGILAADWSEGSATKYFDKYGIRSTEESRRQYRLMLFTTSGIEEFISGVILHDETIRQLADDGTPIAKVLSDRGIIPGIKVDKGTVDMANFPGEKITEGLDGLRDRLLEYAGMGAKFTKWRAVISIGDGLPTKTALEANMHDLARYAALSQEVGLVPIVEPEVLLEGDYSITENRNVTEAGLKVLYELLVDHRVFLEGTLLKPNMVQAGKEYSERPKPEEIAKETISTFKEVVPKEVPGVVFLSGGQSPEEATANLNAINKTGGAPWELSFSYARALQQPVLEVWGGKPEKKDEAQEIFLKRAKLNSLARQGLFKNEMEAQGVLNSKF